MIVQERLEVVLAALDLFALGRNVKANAALLDLQSPGVDEGNDENDGQQRVQQYLDRVIPRLPDLKDLAVLLDLNKAALYVTDGSARLEEVCLAQPVKTTAGNEHIGKEDKLKQKEENTAQDLPVEHITYAEDEEGKLYRPISPCKRAPNVQHLIPNPQTTVLEKAEDGEQNTQEPRRDRADKQLQVIEKRLKLI